jgi:dipeptidyl aminopeptidase/acylaminoacyl peptidase
MTLLSFSALAQEEEKAAAGEKEKEKKEEGLPLKPMRTIEFTTQEGTWLSLDVSPDGQTVVFELLGDLYTLPLAGGEATRVTSGMAFDSQPRFSPDGEWIAFLSDRDGAENLWIARADGSEPKKLSKDEQAEFASPNWSPDGDYVIVSRTGWGLRTFELWMYHVKGTHPTANGTTPWGRCFRRTAATSTTPARAAASSTT